MYSEQVCIERVHKQRVALSLCISGSDGPGAEKMSERSCPRANKQAFQMW